MTRKLAKLIYETLRNNPHAIKAVKGNYDMEVEFPTEDPWLSLSFAEHAGSHIYVYTIRKLAENEMLDTIIGWYAWKIKRLIKAIRKEANIKDRTARRQKQQAREDSLQWALEAYTDKKVE